MKDIFRWPVLWWLRFWAQLVLKINKPFIVGVTGSAGKSSAVDSIAPVLRLKFKNLKVAEKANSESGIPADILGLHFTDYSPLDWLRVCVSAPFSFFLFPSSFDCYLVEMGIDEPTPPKNMEYLLTILRPDIGIILNALPVHTQQFGSVTAITKEKGKLVTQNSNLKYAILNADQPEISSLKPVPGARVVTFGKKENSDIVVKSITSSLKGTIITLFINPKSYFINLPNTALPEFYGHTISAALAVAFALDLNLQEAADAVSANFKLPPGRGRIFEGIKNTTIIDSSYNASGETMFGSLKMLEEVNRKQRAENNEQLNRHKKRKIIGVLGDMRELGNQAEKEHQVVAKIAEKVLDQAVLVGPLMKQYVLPILEELHKPVEWFLTAGEAAKYLTANLFGKEIILVKGSQNTIFLEIVVEALLKNKSDISSLCRRGKFWEKERRPYQ